jgi:hypothetical protein
MDLVAYAPTKSFSKDYFANQKKDRYDELLLSAISPWEFNFLRKEELVSPVTKAG